MSNHTKELLSHFSGQTAILTIPAIYIRFTGAMEAAALISQIIYWSDRTKDPDGWFYKTYSEWESEICLTEYQVRRHTKRFTEQGFLETKLKKINGAPTVHYRLKWDNFSESILKFLRDGNPKNSGNLDTEETSESNPKEFQNPINKETKTTNKDYSKTTPIEEGRDFLDDDFDPIPESLVLKSFSPSVEPLNQPTTNQDTPKVVNIPPSRSGYEYGNKCQQLDHLFDVQKFPWSGNDRFIEWLADNWVWGNESDNRELKIASRQDWLRRRERSWDIEAIQSRWKAYQSAEKTEAIAPEEIKKAIGQELRRLNRYGDLPVDWVRRTGARTATELNAKDAAEYLTYLRSQEGAA